MRGGMPAGSVERAACCTSGRRHQFSEGDVLQYACTVFVLFFAGMGVGRSGFEPAIYGLKVRCSSAELTARSEDVARSSYSVPACPQIKEFRWSDLWMAMGPFSARSR